MYRAYERPQSLLWSPLRRVAHLCLSALFLATLACGVGFVTPSSALAQDGCDWTRVWPEEGTDLVSAYRSAFFLSGLRACGVLDARLVGPDGSEVPLDASVEVRTSLIELRESVSGPPLDLQPDTMYTITFSWYDPYQEDWISEEEFLENVRRLPARPYTFRTSPTLDPREPLTLDDLRILEFEISPNAKEVTFMAEWPDASPLYHMEFSVPDFPEDRSTHRPEIRFPASYAPDLHFVFPSRRTRGRDRTCVDLWFVADSVLGGEETFERSCVDNGCSSVASAPSLATLGVLALLLVGRRRRQSGW